MPELPEEMVEALLRDQEVERAVMAIRRARDEEQLDEAATDLILAAAPDIRSRFVGQLVDAHAEGGDELCPPLRETLDALRAQERQKGERGEHVRRVETGPGSPDRPITWKEDCERLQAAAIARREEGKEAAQKERQRIREALEPLIHKHVECTCLWDLDEDHPDFGVEGAEEPLKVIRPDADCPQHMILDSLEDDDA